MSKRPTGRIVYVPDTSISYSAAGRNPPRPWQVIVDGVGRVNSDKTYAWAAIHLANDLAWRDPRVLALREKADLLERDIIAEHMERLTAERPDQDNMERDMGRIEIYAGGDMTCAVCFRHGDHESIQVAHAHGCNR